MGRRSRSKRTRKREKKQRSRPVAVRQRSPEELIDAHEFDAAIDLLHARLTSEENADDRRLLGVAYALKADEAPYADRKVLSGQALDHLECLPTPTDPHALQFRIRVACNAYRWDSARQYADLLLNLSETAVALYYRAVATLEAWNSYQLREDHGAEALPYIERALDKEDAWPGLYLFRADAEGWSDAGRERRREILEAARRRFPDDADLAVGLARAVHTQDLASALTLVLPHARSNPPHGAALLSAIRYAATVEPDLALELVDLAEPHASEPWAGFEFLRGKVELDRDRCEEALAHFRRAAALAADLRDRGTEFESWMGVAAVATEEKDLPTAYDAIVRASDLLLEPFNVGVPTQKWVYVRDELLSLDELEGLDHDIPIRHLRNYANGAYPQSDTVLTRLELLAHALHADDYNEDPPPFPDFLEWDPRFILLKARHDSGRGEYVSAFGAALDFTLWAIEFGAEDDDVARIGPTEYWQDKLWDHEKAEYVPAPDALQAEFSRTAYEKLMNLVEEEERAVELVFAPLYRSKWRSHLVEHGSASEGLAILARIGQALPPADALFDTGYFLLEDRGEEPAARAEEQYRKYIAEFGVNAAVANNLAVALTRQAKHLEAGEMFELAAEHAEDPEEYRKKAERARSTAEAEERREAEARELEEQERKRLENHLASAPERWPQLNYYQRRLLCTLSAISEFESFDHLAELAGQDRRYVPRHYEKLQEWGMLVVENGRFDVNPHVRELVERERSHAVYTHIIHTDGRIAFKPIFNSRNEYRFYQSLLEIFPNNLVFPNMALQAIFSFDRMKELLDSEEFGYYLRASVDFCITSTATYLPIVAFEADSYWHDTERQKERDAIKDKIFRLGGVSLIRLRPYGRPSENALRSDVIRSVREWLATRTTAEVPEHGLDPVAELDTSRLEMLPA